MAITLANHSAVANVTGGSVTSIAAAAKNMTTGNLIVAGVRNRSNNPTVTDTAGNTYIKIDNQSNMQANDYFTMFYCANCTGNSNNIVTANFPSEAYVAIFVQEFTDVDTLDQKTQASTSSATASITSPQFTTINANEAIVGMGSSWNTGKTFASSTDTLIGADTGGMAAHLYSIVSSIQTNRTSTMSVTSGTTGWEFCVATFYKATVGGRTNVSTRTTSGSRTLSGTRTLVSSRTSV